MVSPCGCLLGSQVCGVHSFQSFGGLHRQEQCGCIPTIATRSVLQCWRMPEMSDDSAQLQSAVPLWSMPKNMHYMRWVVKLMAAQRWLTPLIMRTAVKLISTRGLRLSGAVRHTFPAWAIVAIALGSVLILVVGALAALLATYRQRSSERAAATAGQRQTLLPAGVRAFDAQSIACELTPTSNCSNAS